MLKFVDAKVADKTWFVLAQVLFQSCKVFCEEFVAGIRDQFRQLDIREAAVFRQGADDVRFEACLLGRLHQPTEIREHAPIKRLYQRKVSVMRNQCLVVSVSDLRQIEKGQKKEVLEYFAS